MLRCELLTALVSVFDFRCIKLTAHKPRSHNPPKLVHLGWKTVSSPPLPSPLKTVPFIVSTRGAMPLAWLISLLGLTFLLYIRNSALFLIALRSWQLVLWCNRLVEDGAGVGAPATYILET